MRVPTKSFCIGPASTVKAMMVQMDTTERVFTQNFKAGTHFECIEVDTLNKQPLQRVSIPLRSDKTLHFVASDEMSGWFYVITTTALGTGCSCKRPHCSHLETLRLAQVATA